jgi:hypothetical protein
VRSLSSHLERGAPDVRAAFAAIEALLAGVGPHSLVAVKTMIVIRAGSNFGGVVIHREHLDLGIMLPRPLSHARVFKTETLGPRKHAHYVRLATPGDVDGEVEAWLREAYETAVKPAPPARTSGKRGGPEG